MKHRLTVRWVTKDRDVIGKIRQRFNMPHYTTLNGLTPAEIDDADMPLFNETARWSFFQIMHVKWRKNGEVFVFQSC